MSFNNNKVDSQSLMFSQGNSTSGINPLNTELNSICYLLALLGAHHFLHVSGIRVNRRVLVGLQHNQDNRQSSKKIISTNCCIHMVVPPDDGPRYA